MTSLAARLARPEVLAVAPQGTVDHADEAYGPDAVRLDANENPYPPLYDDPLGADANRYPESRPVRLRQTMAALYGVAAENLIVTRDVDDAIDLLIRTFCRAGVDALAISQPSGSSAVRYADLQGARVIEVPPAADFEFDADAFIRSVRADASPKLAFIGSPNDVTGSLIQPAEILRVVEALPETIVVVDESLIEFSEGPSLAVEATGRDNLVVLRTLSQAYGIASARVGAAIGDPELIELVGRALAPSSLTTHTVQAALATLSPSRRPIHEERIGRIKADRERLAERLASSPLVTRVHAAGGNFLFLKVKDAGGLASHLRGLGVRVRFAPDAAPGGIRITIGAEAENDAVLAAFGVAAAKRASRRAEVVRDTRETRIAVAVDLDAAAPRRIDTGVAFFDHMLDQVAAHGGFSLTLACEGDLKIDAHHSLEDCAIALGAALSRALADRRGIARFGFSLPMDETEAHVLIDLSGRPYAVFEGDFEASHIGAYPTQMTAHIFRSLSQSLGAAIHVRVTGDNDHHKTEACFKAFGRALRQAVGYEADPRALPSTKGVL
jgi:histidinol-phosphate aminotransferase